MARISLLQRRSLCLCLVVVLYCFAGCRATWEHICHDPDVGGTIQNSDRRFMVLGSDDAGGAGLGNLLIFYPAAYYFAAFTNRDLVIADHSIIGEMCKVITCGFPMVSEMALAYPGILSQSRLDKAPHVKKQDMMKHIEGGADIDALVVRMSGFMAASDWWVYFPETVKCVHKITGCDLGDVQCAERHAFQRLVRGPFKKDLTAQEEERIQGVPQNIKHAILSLPHAYAPRFDAAVHIRAQFKHFEEGADINSTAYKEEVRTWINSTEGQEVFNEIESKLLTELGQDSMHRGNGTFHHGITSPTTGNATGTDPIYVYLAADNEEVKDAFIAHLEQRHDHHYEIRVMRVETKFIHHVKNLKQMKRVTNNEGILDLVFDWYALSLANEIFAWRKGSTQLISTFSHSASRVSGTTQRTDVNKPLGEGGIGTKGFSLAKNKRGISSWSAFWAYSFLEDYDEKYLAEQAAKAIAEKAAALSSGGAANTTASRV